MNAGQNRTHCKYGRLEIIVVVDNTGLTLILHSQYHETYNYYYNGDVTDVYFKNSKDQIWKEGQDLVLLIFVYRLNYNMGFVVKCVDNTLRAHTRE